MLLITTGISGSGRKEYLREFEKYAKLHGKKVKVYYVGDLLFEQAEKIGIAIGPESVLNANPSVINSLRSAVFENILLSLPRELKKNDAVILSIHSFFYWKKIFTRAYDRFYVGQFKADLFATIINEAGDIKKRLNSRKQWKVENLTMKEILLWQNVEVEVTSSWADMYFKPFYVVPFKQPLSTLYRLLFCPFREPVYVSMPITHLGSKKDQKRIDEFIARLNKHFTIFDPRTVEKLSNAVSFKKERDPVFYNQIVNRDLYWFIKQSKRVIAFFPKIVPSPGVINELREAYETNKDVWVIYPGKRGSPFLSYFSSRVFGGEEEFFKFLRKRKRQE